MDDKKKKVALGTAAAGVGVAGAGVLGRNLGSKLPDQRYYEVKRSVLDGHELADELMRHEKTVGTGLEGAHRFLPGESGYVEVVLPKDKGYTIAAPRLADGSIDWEAYRIKSKLNDAEQNTANLRVAIARDEHAGAVKGALAGSAGALAVGLGAYAAKKLIQKVKEKK